MDRGLLWKAVVEHSDPLVALAASLVSYGWGRRFALNAEVSRRIFPHRVIAAGSPYAPYELAVHLVGLIDVVRRWNETEGVAAHLPTHVDNVSVVLQGQDRGLALEVAGRLAALLAAHVASTGMKLDLGDKAFALASDASLLRQLKGQLGVLGGSALHSVRELGADYALSDQGRKIAAVRWERLRSGLRRYKRLKRLGCLGVGTEVVASGGIPHVSYGSALSAPTVQDRKIFGETVNQVGIKRPLGVHQVVAVGKAGLDTDFMFTKEAIHR